MGILKPIIIEGGGSSGGGSGSIIKNCMLVGVSANNAWKRFSFTGVLYEWGDFNPEKVLIIIQSSDGSIRPCIRMVDFTNNTLEVKTNQSASAHFMLQFIEFY